MESFFSVFFVVIPCLPRTHVKQDGGGGQGKRPPLPLPRLLLGEDSGTGIASRAPRVCCAGGNTVRRNRCFGLGAWGVPTRRRLVARGVCAGWRRYLLVV